MISKSKFSKVLAIKPSAHIVWNVSVSVFSCILIIWFSTLVSDGLNVNLSYYSVTVPSTDDKIWSELYNPSISIVK